LNVNICIITGRSVNIYEAQSAKYWCFMTTLMDDICAQTSTYTQSRLYQILSAVPVLRNTIGSDEVYVRRILQTLCLVN